MNSTTVLLVDDNEIEHMAIQRALNHSEKNWDLSYIESGEQAIEYLKHLEPLPSIVLLDLNMKSVSGFEFLDEIRTSQYLSNLIVFVLTSSKNPKDINLAYTFNVAGYIVKNDMGDRYEKLAHFLEEYVSTISIGGCSAH